jgi:hypothetical protein
MTGGPGSKDAPHTLSDEERAPGKDVLSGLGELERRAMLTWVGENLPDVRRSVYGQRILYWTLGVGFIVGLATYVGGYVLRSSVTTSPLSLQATCSTRSVGHSGPVSSWSCSSRSSRRQSGVDTSSCSMLTRQRCAIRPEPKATKHRGWCGCSGRSREQVSDLSRSQDSDLRDPPPCGWMQ